MFVFPAFDVNYKTRKRSFRCCQNCRIKKVKCEINSTNSELCSNCRKHKWQCDLSKSDDNLIDHQIKDERITIFNTPDNRSRGDNKVKRKDNALIPKIDSWDTEKITPQYLKDKYNFNISGMGRTFLYQYLVHGHPKAIMGNKMEDQSVWHESGVYIDDKSKPDLNGQSSKAYKNNSFRSEFHIRNRKTYNILLSIDAFTLSTDEYPLSSSEIRELLELYFYKINSLFPIVKEKGFWAEFDANEVPTILVYAIVLVILRDTLAEPILKNMFARNREASNRGDDFTDNLVNFITDLEYKIRQVTLVLPQLGDIDKVTLLVELLLLSLHFSFDRLGNEQSSHDLTDAINLAVSSGIHMKSQHSNKACKEEIEYTTNLWWCCYVLDRFNALTNSRCIFTKQEDFNVDLPYSNINLLKLVQLARSYENMTIAIYQPYNNNDLNNSNALKRDKLFNVDEFQRFEFEFCEKERLSGNLFCDVQGLVNNGKIINTDASVEAYTAACIHFLTRLLNNTIILISQKAKYDNIQIPNSIPEAVALEASKNILRYVIETKGEISLNIPIIPWCIALGMAVSLKKKAKYMLTTGDRHAKEDDCVFDLHNYITVLDEYSKKWWVVDEICKLTKDFFEKLNTSSTLNKRYSNGKDSEHKRLKNEKSFNRGEEYPNGLEFSQNQSSVDIFNHKLRYTPIGDAMKPSNLRVNPIPSILNMLNESKEENIVTPFEFNSSTPNNNYIANNSAPNTTSYERQVGTPPFSDQYHDFLESMHIDLFDNDFLKDFPNIVNQLMEGESNSRSN